MIIIDQKKENTYSLGICFERF